MLRRLLLALPLLIITEGHMSGSVSDLSLQDIVLRSDAIFLVEKAEPYVVRKATQVGKQKGQDFTYTWYRFKVRSLVHARVDKAPKDGVLEVQDADDEENARQTQNRFEGKPTKILIYERYEPKASRVDSLKEFLIFTSWRKDRKRFTLVAQDAMEGADQVPEVRRILAESDPSSP